MPERRFHRDIAIPLLQAIGASNVQYLHGSFERGKDISYTIPDEYGDDRLVVCQVKCEKLTGQAGNMSSSAAGVLQQLLQARDFEVLNPITHVKEQPQRTVLYTLYDLPDAALADGQMLLREVRRSCKIVGPGKILALLKLKLPHLYTELAFPGSGLSNALLRHVSIHQEAGAFSTSKERSLDDFFVNLGIASSSTVLQGLSSGAYKLRQMERVDLPKETIRTLRILSAALKPVTGNVRLIGTEMDDEDRLDHSWLSAIHLGAVVDAFGRHLTRIRKRLARVPNDPETLRDVRTALAGMNLLNRVLQMVEARAGNTLVELTSGRGTSAYDFSFPGLNPAAFVDGNYNLCIVGEAGAGKTSIARAVVREAIRQGTECLYFPCSRVKGGNLTRDIARFLESIGASSSPAHTKRLLTRAKLIVLDGCDEALTFEGGLGEEIRRFSFPKPVKVARPTGTQSKLVIPTDMRDVVRSVRGHIVLHSPIDPYDFDRLIFENRGTDFEKTFERLRIEARRSAPRFILTSRDAGPLHLTADFQIMRVMPFTDKELERFFEKWFVGSSKDYTEILEFFKSTPHIKEVCRTPIVATIVAALHENDLDLPRNRAEVYEKRFELLLGKWDRLKGVPQRARVNAKDKMHLLTRLALNLHKAHRRRFSLRDAANIWNEGFSRTYPGLRCEEVLAELRTADNVIVPEGSGEYSLGHLSYQEFLCAKGIVLSQQNMLLRDNFSNPWWRQVLIFYAGICGDIEKLVRSVQIRGRLASHDGLLDEMINEARYTSPLVTDVVRDMGPDQLLDHVPQDPSQWGPIGSPRGKKSPNVRRKSGKIGHARVRRK